MENSESKENHRNSSVKMASYLEKRGKKKVISSWKKYWFVLDDRLLLYYKSELEYVNLSACKGSINMGLATCVKPGSPRNNATHPIFIVDIVTRAQIISLRTKDRMLQEQWIQALLDSMALPSTPAPLGRPMQFRYSMDNLPVVKEDEQNITACNEKKNTLPSEAKSMSGVSRQESILRKIKALGGQSYGGSMDTILKLKTLNHKVKPSQDSDVQKTDKIKVNTKVLHDDEISDTTTKEDQEFGSTHIEMDKLDESCENENSSELKPDIKSDVIFVNKNCESDNNLDDTLKGKNICNDGHVRVEPSSNIDSVSISYSKLEINVDYETVNEENRDKIYDRDHTSVVVENKYYQNTEGLSKVSEESIKNDVQINGGENKNVKEMKVENVCTSEYAEPKVVNFNVPEDEDYNEYDAVLLPQNLEEKKNLVQEPILPPRPHPGQHINTNKDSHDDIKLFEKASHDHTTPHEKDSHNDTTLYDNAEYENFYVDYKISEKVKSASKETLDTKKSLIKKLKKKNQNTEHSNKDDLKYGEEQQSEKEKRMKHKKSFLRKMLGKYRKKKPEREDIKGNADDPEYEVVEFLHTSPETVLQTAETVQQEQFSFSDENKVENEIAVSVILPSGIMNELKKKINDRKNSLSSETVQSGDEEQDDYEVVYGGSAVNVTEDVVIKTLIPSPVPKVKLTEMLEKDIDKGDERPGLPPRQVHRPHSPWHDTPSNNSSIYDSITKSSSEHTQSELKIQDELLGTPEGFILLREKWLEAEKSDKDVSCVVSSETTKKRISYEVEEDNTQLSEQCKDKVSKTEVIKRENINSDVSSNLHSLTGNSVSCESPKDGCTEKYTEEVNDTENYCKVDEFRNSSGTDHNIPKVWVSEITDIHLTNTDKRVSTESYGKTNSFYNALTEIENEIAQPKIDLHNEYENVETITVIHVIDSNMNISGELKDTVDIEKDSLILSVDCSELEESQAVDSLTSSPLENSLIDQDIYHYLEHSTVNKVEMNPILQDDSEFIFQDTLYHTQCLGRIVDVDCQEAAKAFKCMRYNTDGAITEECVVPMNKRHSNELNTLLAQLAELTSAPLLSPGVTISLIDFPPQQSSVDQFDINKLGPIRRRRHSDPDYDVPRPHRALVKSLPVECMGTQNVNEDRHTPPIEPTRFLEQERMGECPVNDIVNNISSISPDSLDSPETVYWLEQ